jgi:hypothetical protein
MQKTAGLHVRRNAKNSFSSSLGQKVRGLMG